MPRTRKSKSTDIPEAILEQLRGSCPADDGERDRRGDAALQEGVPGAGARRRAHPSYGLSPGREARAGDESAQWDNGQDGVDR